MKSVLKDLVTEVLEEHDVEDSDLIDDLTDRIGGAVDVMDDTEDEEATAFGE